MNHPLDGLDPIYADDVADIIQHHTSTVRDTDFMEVEEYMNMKADLLEYFRKLEADGHCRSGMGFDFITYIDEKFADIIR